MSARYFSDSAEEELQANLLTHDAEEFYVEYPDASEPLAKELAVALEKAQWARQSDIVSYGGSLPDRPDIEIETPTMDPEGGVQVLIEWLAAQNFSVNHIYNPDISAVAIRVDQSNST